MKKPEMKSSIEINVSGSTAVKVNGEFKVKLKSLAVATALGAAVITATLP